MSISLSRPNERRPRAQKMEEPNSRSAKVLAQRRRFRPHVKGDSTHQKDRKFSEVRLKSGKGPVQKFVSFTTIYHTNLWRVKLAHAAA